MPPVENHPTHKKGQEKRPLMIWLDLEMSGLNPDINRILEVAAVVTDWELNPKDTFETVVFQNSEHLNIMDSWCVSHHTASGLIDKVPHGISEQEADRGLRSFIDRNVLFPDQQVILCGNSIWQDRRFIDRYFKQTSDRIHYRMLDISSLKILFSNKFSVTFQKQNKHRALDDILESVQELKHYLSYIHVPHEDGFCRESGKL